MSAPATIVVTATTLERFATEIFVAAGLSPSMSSEWAQALVWADRRGVDSHGVLRIPWYMELIKQGVINPAARMRVTQSKAAVCTLDADRAPGPVAMSEAVRLAIEAARSYGVGWCGARNITHAGAVGQFAAKAADAGLASIVISASSPLMAYHGSRAAGVSTNPLAIAFPRSQGSPLLLDMSTSTVAHGKILSAQQAGLSIPLGWALDKEGCSTTNSRDAEILTPLGGAKGSGLSLMIECLTSVALSNPVIATALSSPSGEDGAVSNGAVFALDLSAFGDLDAIRREADRLADAILALPPGEGVERLYLPGGRGDAVSCERDTTGIPLTARAWERLVQVAADLGVMAPPW